MCRPIAGNEVHPKKDCRVRPMLGSAGISIEKKIKLSRRTRGVTEGPSETTPDHFIVLFDVGDNAIARVEMSHLMLKGVEPDTHIAR